MEKVCRRCGRSFPMDNYFRNCKTADGHLNICKGCVKIQQFQYRKEHIEEIRSYDRERARLPHRKELCSAITKRRRREVEGYQKCHSAVDRAIRSGRIKRLQYCQVCGRVCKTEAHHNDYSKPYDVIWLCSSCHSQYHIGTTEEATEIRNAVGMLFDAF